MVQKGHQRNFISTLVMIASHDKILNDYLSGFGISNENVKALSRTGDKRKQSPGGVL